MAMTCQVSYPLNSENAIPPGTFRVYLSGAEMALAPTRARTAAIVPIVNMLFRFITAPPVCRRAPQPIRPPSAYGKISRGIHSRSSGIPFGVQGGAHRRAGQHAIEVGLQRRRGELELHQTLPAAQRIERVPVGDGEGFTHQ